MVGFGDWGAVTAAALAMAKSPLPAPELPPEGVSVCLGLFHSPEGTCQCWPPNWKVVLSNSGFGAGDCFLQKHSLLKNISFDLETNWAGRPLALAGSFRGAFCRPLSYLRCQGIWVQTEGAPAAGGLEAGKLLREHAHECKGVVPWRRHAPAQSWIWMMPAPCGLQHHKGRRADPGKSTNAVSSSSSSVSWGQPRRSVITTVHQAWSSPLACLARQDVQSFSVHAVRRGNGIPKLRWVFPVKLFTYK